MASRSSESFPLIQRTHRSDGSSVGDTERDCLYKRILGRSASRLAVEHEQRPATYRDILSSPAMQSLPRDVTPEEYELVDAVIPTIPPYSLGEE